MVQPFRGNFFSSTFIWYEFLSQRILQMKFWLFKFRSTAKNGKALFLNKENAIFFKLLILFQIVIAKVCNFHTKKARFDSPRRNSPRNKRLGELPEKVLKRSSKIPFCGRGLNSLLPLTSYKPIVEQQINSD